VIVSGYCLSYIALALNAPASVAVTMRVLPSGDTTTVEAFGDA